MSKRKCISRCIKRRNSSVTIFNPFVGLLEYTYEKDADGLCVGDQYNEEYNKMSCDGKTKVDIRIENFISNPIGPMNYLEAYYGLSDFSEIERYIEQRTDMNVYAKSRLFDYICLRYFGDMMRYMGEMVKIVKMLLGIDGDDQDIIRVLKKLRNKYYMDANLVKDMLDKIKSKLKL